LALFSAWVSSLAVTFCVSKPESVCGVFERIFSAIERFAERSSRGRATLKRVRERAFQELENFCAAVVAIREEGRKVILFALFLSAALWTVDFCIPSLILLGLNAPPVWLFSFAAQFLLLVLVALPTTPAVASQKSESLRFTQMSSVCTFSAFSRYSGASSSII